MAFPFGVRSCSRHGAVPHSCGVGTSYSVTQSHILLQSHLLVTFHGECVAVYSIVVFSKQLGLLQYYAVLIELYAAEWLMLPTLVNFYATACFVYVFGCVLCQVLARLSPGIQSSGHRQGSWSSVVVQCHKRHSKKGWHLDSDIGTGWNVLDISPCGS